MAAVERLAIIGTGLIGASVGLAARAAGVGDVRGWDIDPAALAMAVEREAVDAADSLGAAVSGVELVIVAAPVAVLPGQVAAVSHGCPTALFRGVNVLNTIAEGGH